MQTTPERLGEAFERARRHWRMKRAEPLQLPAAAPATALTVAISRECGAGGEAVAQALGARLGWPVYDRELVEKIAEETGLRTELVESVDEKRSSWLLECLQSFGGEKTLGSSEFARRLTETLLALAAHGQSIIVGRGATVILPGETSLHVRLVAPLRVRIARVKEKLGLSEHEAERRIADSDAERNGFVRAHFHVDPTDVHLYDLVLNTGRLSPPECAELIAAAAQQLSASGQGR